MDSSQYRQQCHFCFANLSVTTCASCLHHQVVDRPGQTQFPTIPPEYNEQGVGLEGPAWFIIVALLWTVVHGNIIPLCEAS